MSAGSECKLEAACAVCLQEHVLPVRLPCSHVYCFLCAKGLFLKGSQCALCRQRIPNDFFRHPESAILSSARGCVNSGHSAESHNATEDGGPNVVVSKKSRLDSAERTTPEGDEDLKPVTSELGQGAQLFTSAPSDEDQDVKVNVDADRSGSSAEDRGASISVQAKEAEEYCWFYAGRNGWWKYDGRTNAELERVFSATPDGAIDLLIVGTLYHIDLAQLVQFQRERPTLKRRIKRDRHDAVSLGVAGLRLSQPSEGDRNVRSSIFGNS